jgi:hypothetical protein
MVNEQHAAAGAADAHTAVAGWHLHRVLLLLLLVVRPVEMLQPLLLRQREGLQDVCGLMCCAAVERLR